MSYALTIGFWAALFAGSHLLISSSAIRPALIQRIGEQPYRGLYSLVAFATFIPLLIVFSHHKHAGPLLWYWRANPMMRSMVRVLMLAALIFFVGSFVNPNPGAIGAPGARPIAGILKITRHPNFVAITIFALAHLLMNGWLGDLFFFGSIAALAIIGGVFQDHRKLSELGAPYQALVETTSFFPGWALMTGRQQWSFADTPWIAIIGGVALMIILAMLHPRFFGGMPLS